MCVCVHAYMCVWCGVQVCARREKGNQYGLEILKIAAQVDGYGGTVPCYHSNGPQE